MPTQTGKSSRILKQSIASFIFLYILVKIGQISQYIGWCVSNQYLDDHYIGGNVQPIALLFKQYHGYQVDQYWSDTYLPIDWFI